MFPSTRKERVMARWKQDDTQDSVKDMVLDYVSIRVDFGGPQPVDCSNSNDYDDISRRTILDGTELGQQRRAKEKSKGKGFQGRCHNCGQFGHPAAECSAKGGCWTCSDPTHRAADCSKGKGKGKNNTGMSNGKGNLKGTGRGKKNGSNDWYS